MRKTLVASATAASALAFVLVASGQAGADVTTPPKTRPPARTRGPGHALGVLTGLRDHLSNRSPQQQQCRAGHQSVSGGRIDSWMSVAPAEVKLAPDATAEAKVTIKVPKDAPEGEQYGVVWA